jgi:class 3 adenylate cyclase/tetratricopeptide (TPR) repeat protein
MAESRKVVTIVFSDVTGSTALGEQLDPEAMRRIMERYFAEMGSVIERHGGTVEKFIGDAVMAVFGIPAVHEDDALRAVRAAAEMRECLAALNEELAGRRVAIAVRTGVNTGEVVAGDPSRGQSFATGDAVNVAARLEQVAAPGEILLGPLTHQLVRQAVRADAVEPLELKGKSETVEAWRLVEVLPDVPAYTRRIDAPFVGREAELAVLRSAWERARDSGSCELVTVAGVPGIGKSRLVRELVTALGDEARVVVGRCLSYGDGITYWPLAEIVREVAGSDARAGLTDLLGAGSDDALATERLLGAIGQSDQPARTEEIFWATRILLERLAGEKPLLVVLDDIHWGEETLLDLLEYLAGFARAPMLLACTARPDLWDARPQWSRVNAMELAALDPSDAEALIDSLLRDTSIAVSAREEIRERAEGNPLFVEQMLALAAENENGELEVPPTIRSLLDARLDHLGVEERAVLVRGAVEGRLFHRGAVSALLDDDARDGLPGRLLALARKSFVRPDDSLFPGDDAFRFVHVLVRDAAYEAAPKELRAALHERFADWLEEQAHELDEIVGYHLEQACAYHRALGEQADELARRAGTRLADAGQRAARRSDYGAVVSLLGRARDLLPAGDPLAVEIALPLATALTERGRLADADGLLASVAHEARALGLEVPALRLDVERMRLRSIHDPDWSGDEALALVERALPVFDAADDQTGLAQAWRLRREVEWFRGRLRASRQAAEEQLAHAERTDDPELVADAFTGIGAPSWFGDDPLSQMWQRHERIFEWARSAGFRATEAMMTLVRGRILIESRRVEEGRAFVASGFEVLGDLGLELTRVGLAAQFTLGELALDPVAVEGRLRAAVERLQAAGETGMFSTTAAQLSLLLARKSELDEAEWLARASQAAGSADDVMTQSYWRIARALVLAKHGQAAKAVELAREAVSIAASTEYVQMIAEIHIGQADVLRALGRREEATEELRAALTIYERKEFELSADAVRAQLAELQPPVGSVEP